MTVEEKVALVAGVRGEYGPTVPLGLLGLARSTWYYRRRQGRRSYEEKYAHLRGPLEQIARAHSEYGYRRTAVELREVYGHAVNQKVVRRLHRLWGLPLLRGTKPPRPSGIRQAIEEAAERANLVARLATIEPLQVLYTDFTELLYADGRDKAYLVPMVDHASKVALGWAVGPRCVTPLALEAWERAKARLEGLGRCVSEVIVHHDRDSVFTSYAWTSRVLLKDRAQLSYALRGARDNPEMEAFIARFKTENRSLFLDATSLEELQEVVDERMWYYNRVRRHSALGYRAPYDSLLSPGWEG